MRGKTIQQAAVDYVESRLRHQAAKRKRNELVQELKNENAHESCSSEEWRSRNQTLKESETNAQNRGIPCGSRWRTLPLPKTCEPSEPCAAEPAIPTSNYTEVRIQ